jgi:hypothetical protein
VKGTTRGGTSRLFVRALGLGGEPGDRHDGRLRIGAMIAAAALFLAAAVAAGALPALRPATAPPHGHSPTPGGRTASATPAPASTPAPVAVVPEPPPAPGGDGSPQGPAPTPTPAAAGPNPGTSPTPGPPAAPPPAPTPAPSPTPPTPVPATVTAWSGPTCSSSGTPALSFFNAGGSAPPWHGTSASPSGYDCSSPRYSLQSGSSTSWRNAADWVFTPGSATSCTFSIYVANGTWSSSVLYNVYAGDTTAGFGGAPFASFRVDQHSLDAGGWVTEGPFSFSAGTIDLSITDAGTDPHFGAVADVVRATCS